MKVLLIIPTVNYPNDYPPFLSVSDFPVGFAYIAGALEKAGHTVYGLNPNNDVSHASVFEMLTDMISNSIEEKRPDLVGIGGLCTDFIFLRDCISIIRRISPVTPIVMGGRIISYDADFLFRKLRPDFCVIGDGEEVIVELARAIETNQKNLEGIMNLGFWDNGTPIFNARNTSYPNVDDKPFPSYEPFGIDEMLDNYSLATRTLYRYTRLDPRPMTIVTARGCPFGCTFCVNDKIRRYRARSIENIMRELALSYEKYHFNVLVILDELFAINKKRVREFSAAIIEGRRRYGWDFDWIFQTHASASLDEETLEIAKQAGCYMFSYGLESASPRVLKSMNKKTKQPQITEAIRVADKVGIGFGGNFIFGDVAENTQTICETMDFFSAHCRDIHIFFNYIQPYPGSKLFDLCIEKNIIKSKDKYYERGCSLSRNMTDLPGYIWFSWQRKLINLSSRFGWPRSVKTVTIEKEEIKNPIAISHGHNIFSIRAACPFCGNESSYREILDYGKENNSGSRLPGPLTKIKEKLHNAGIVWRLGLFRHYVLSVFLTPVLSKINPAFKKLDYLRAEQHDNKLSFVTGCKHCHKRIRIVLP